MNDTPLTPQQFVEDFDRKRQEFLSRRGKVVQSQKHTQKEAAYWEMVFSKESTPTTPQRLPIVQEMEYQDAAAKVRELFKDRAQEISDIENRPFKWEFSPELVGNITQLIRYFINDPECAFPLSKGLFLYGPHGTTKTETMGIMQRFCQNEKLSKSFKMSNMSKIYTDTKVDKDYNPIEQAVQFTRCFDEFGRHMGPVARFGEPIDVNEAIIEQRYERFKHYGQITFLISNCDTRQLGEGLSQMVFDRLRSMVTSIKFTGHSKR